MFVCKRVVACAVLLALVACAGGGERRAGRAHEIADYARSTYADASLSMLRELVAFRTVHEEGVDNAENPEFQAMTAFLRQKAGEFGFDFTDSGAVVVIGLGDRGERLGVVTHGDVQPADATKWAEDPFSLDSASEPGKLLGRGVEDDKGPIASALYAMKALKHSGLPLKRRVELIISYTEESDWDPFRDFLAKFEPPQLNVAIDAEYPVVVAEKGWGLIQLMLPPDEETLRDGPRLLTLSGGAFLSQIPGDASAVIAEPTPELEG